MSFGKSWLCGKEGSVLYEGLVGGIAHSSLLSCIQTYEKSNQSVIALCLLITKDGN